MNKDNQKYIDDLNFDITNLKISVSSFDESGTSLDEMIERINQDIEHQKDSIRTKTEQAEIINLFWIILVMRKIIYRMKMMLMLIIYLKNKL